MNRYVEEQMKISNSFQQYFIIVLALFFLIIFACRGRHVIPEPSTEAPAATGMKHRFSEKDRQNFLADRHAVTEGFTCRDCHGTDSPEENASVDKCLDCHGGYEDVAALTEHLSMNPHKSHYGVIGCVLCHKSHEKSTFYCNTCHFFDVEVP